MKNKRGISLIYVTFFSFLAIIFISTIVIYSSNKKEIYFELKKDRLKEEKQKKYILRKEKKKDFKYFLYDKNNNLILFNNNKSIGNYSIKEMLSMYSKIPIAIPLNEKEFKEDILLKLSKKVFDFEITKKQRIYLKNNKIMLEDLGLTINEKN